MRLIAIALTATLIFTASAMSAERTASDTPSVERNEVAEARETQKPKKPRKPKADTSDYFVVTLSEASVVK